MPTVESDYLQKSFPLALQHLFYKLQYQRASVKAWDLLKALEWNSTNVRLQHDVHEVQYTFFKRLEEEEKAGSVWDCIIELLTGHYSKYIESPGIQETQTCKESFIQIPLDVLECKDIYASLERFCGIDTLEEDNDSQGTSDEEGESRHYTLFECFPTVLLFHLKRLYYNPDRKVFLRTNSCYEFYEELDLDYDDYLLLSKNADRTIENKYRLHSVLVNEDDSDGEGYFAIVRHHDKWFKFDHKVVKEVSAEEAINLQFGDQHGTTCANFSEGFESINKSAAVMLVYIHKSEWDRVLCETEKKSLPKQIREVFDKERIAKEEHQKEKQEAHLFVNIKLATEFHFARRVHKNYYFDLIDFDVFKNYRIHKKTPFEDFKEMMSKDFGIPKHRQRFRRWNSQTKNIIQVFESLIEKKQHLKTLLDLRHFRDKNSPSDREKTTLMTIKLFLESPEKTSPNEKSSRNALRPIQGNELLIFIKYYDPELSKLSYLGHVFVERNCAFDLIFEKAKKMAGLSRKDKVIGIKEVKHSPTIVCSEIDPNTTLERMLLFQGDIIVIQKDATDARYEYPTIKSFLEFVQDTKTMTLRLYKTPIL